MLLTVATRRYRSRLSAFGRPLGFVGLIPQTGRVNLRLSVRDGMVRCGSYLSPTKLTAYGTPLRLSGAEGRHWVQWPIESTAVLLARMLDETPDRLHGSDVDPES